MKKLIQKIIQKRNPQFAFAPLLSNAALSNLILGFFIQRLRAIFHGWPAAIKQHIFVGKGTRLEHRSRVQIGQWSKIGRMCLISGFGTEGIKMGRSCSIGDFSKLVVSTTLNHPGKGIELGDNVGIGEYAYLGGAGGLKIGSNSIIGQYLSCHPENHQFEPSQGLIRFQPTTRKGIVIGQNCWIGAKVTVLDGVNVGNNCVIAAGSVVTKSFPDNVVIGGVPAKILKHITSPVENIAA